MEEAKTVQAVEHQFEPMSVGGVLDRAFRLYTENFPLMLGITVILNLPTLFVSMLPLVLPWLGYHPILGIIAAFSTVVIGLLTLLLVYPLVTGATTKAVSDKYLGKPVTIGSALNEAWGNVGTLLLTQLVVGIVVILGLMLLVVPGILWMLSYSLVPPVVMIEATDRKVRPVYSLTGEAKSPVTQIMDRSDIRRRSWELVKGNRGKVFLVLLVFFVMRYLLNSGGSWVASVSFDAGSNASLAVQSIIVNVTNIVVAPLQTIAITLLYYDFRIRKEGFDLEMLSQAMGGPATNA